MSSNALDDDVARCCFLQGCDRSRHLKICQRCKVANYCSQEHQRADWKKTHKAWCKEPSDTSATPSEWWKEDHKCEYCLQIHAWNVACNKPPWAGEEVHEGKPELIVWNWVDDYGGKRGWGNTPLDKSQALKTKFENEFQGNQQALAEYRSACFRWTCCGASLDSSNPCDHHGKGATKCSCDYCIGGKALPEPLRKTTVNNYGLDISRGPDPRSYNSGVAGLNDMMRSVFGMEL